MYVGYHKNKWISLYEEVSISTDATGIWFYADEFSPFVLTWEKKQNPSGGSASGSNGDNVDTGDHGTAFAAIAVNLILLSSAALVYSRRKRISVQAQTQSPLPHRTYKTGRFLRGITHKEACP